MSCDVGEVTESLENEQSSFASPTSLALHLHHLVSRPWNVAHPQSFPSLRESVWTIRKHIFCSRLPFRTPAPTFYASPLQFFSIWSRTWCLHVAPLRCDTTSHTDYVQQAAVGLHCGSQAVNAVCRFSPCIWRTMCMRAHMRQVVVEIWLHSPNFLDTPYIYWRLKVIEMSINSKSALRINTRQKEGENIATSNLFHFIKRNRKITVGKHLFIFLEISVGQLSKLEPPV